MGQESLEVLYLTKEDAPRNSVRLNQNIYRFKLQVCVYYKSLYNILT